LLALGPNFRTPALGTNVDRRKAIDTLIPEGPSIDALIDAFPLQRLITTVSQAVLTTTCQFKFFKLLLLL
jgi:hypothetical protein